MSFKTKDRHGNTVVLTSIAWEHIRTGHPEMENLHRQVRETIESPYGYRKSTTHGNRYVWESRQPVSTSEIKVVRVVVSYKSPNITQGGTSGSVTTAYIDDDAYNSKVGPLTRVTP